MTGTRGPVDERRLVSARLLAELVDHPLDPGYAAAARRRNGDQRRRRYDQPAVALGCLLVGFVVVLAWIHTNRGAPDAAKVHDSLVTRVRNAQDGADRLAGRVGSLEQHLARTRARALPAADVRTLAADQLAAGQIAVHGPGLTVTLREPPAPTPAPSAGRGGSTPIDATNILTDRDVRSVVNELWHDGAEAIAVNGVRLTPTSAIRFAGQAVLVDLEPITSPYTIDAIGDPDRLSTNFAQSQAASRYQTLAGVDGIGFSFTDSERLELPASAPFTPRYATSPPKRGK